MEFLKFSLAGLPAFLAYLGTGIVFVAIFTFVYTRITAHRELQLIKDNVPAAAVAFLGSLAGFCLPVASAMAHSVSLADCVVWATIGLIVQVVTYFLVRVSIPDISKRISSGEMSSGIWLASFSLAMGLLSAASMTY